MNDLGEQLTKKREKNYLPRTPTPRRRQLVIPARQRQRSLSLDAKIVLNWAVSRNDLDTVKGIVESRAQNIDINEPGVDGFYPLHRAATTGSMDCLRFLVDRGATVEVFDKDGLSPLDAAVCEGEYDCALYLIKAGANITNIKYGFLDDKELKPATKVALKKALKQR